MMRTSEKHPDENVTLTFAFDDDLASLSHAGDTVLSSVVTVEVDAGSVATDPAPSAMLSGNPQNDPQQVLHAVLGGLDKVDYLFTCAATMVSGVVLVKQLLVPVRERLQ